MTDRELERLRALLCKAMDENELVLEAALIKSCGTDFVLRACERDWRQRLLTITTWKFAKNIRWACWHMKLARKRLARFMGVPFKKL